MRNPSRYRREKEWLNSVPGGREKGRKGDSLLFLAKWFLLWQKRSMPRTARASVGGICYQVINRGNGRQEVFRKSGDYKAVVDLLDRAWSITMRILGYCVMPNHFHLVLWPHSDGNLGKWMQWLLTAHVRRYYQHYRRYPPRELSPELNRKTPNK